MLTTINSTKHDYLFMHTNPIIWHTFVDDKKEVAFNPKIKQNDSSITIKEGGMRHILLVTLYFVCSLLLTVRVPAVYITPKYQIAAAIMIGLPLLIVGFIHFDRTFKPTQFIKKKDFQHSYLYIREHTPILIQDISAFQIMSKKFNIAKTLHQSSNHIDDTSFQTIYSCFVLYKKETSTDYKKIALFTNDSPSKHRDDCLMIAKFCDKPLWEGIYGNMSIFETDDNAITVALSKL